MEGNTQLIKSVVLEALASDWYAARNITQDYNDETAFFTCYVAQNRG